ncbi:MAG: MFS transporter [Parvibaculum sp.]|uniref:MFS transporter n=1 Tax=Parvibaculum sp. TaxID=2024848 RepID=UPI0027318DB6|nr:MFS transporter [Parvibaculum sp.]MDP1627280.1 MFS transporter [Parvibaculum sp.]MDP2151935.1 MFS transporter [Parvibaculum sp.]
MSRLASAADGIGATRVTWRAWMVVFILLLLVTLAFIDRMSISLMVDPIKASFGIDDFRMGILQGPAFAVFFLIGSLPMGWIVDRYPARWTIYFGVTAWSLATIACGLAGSFTELLIARCLVGLGEAVLQPASWSLVARLFPPKRLALAISVLSSGAQVGAAASYVMGGVLIAQATAIAADPLPVFGQVESWQVVFLACGVLGVAMAFLIFAAPRERKAGASSDGTGNAGLGRFIRDNRVFLFCHFLGFSLLCAMTYGAAAWLPTLLMRSHGLDVRTVGTLLAAVAVTAGIGGFVFNGWWVDRAFARGRKDAHLRHFALVGGAVAIIGGFGFSLGATAVVLVLCFAVIQFLQPFSGVAGAVLQIATPPEYRGRISAAFILLYNSAGIALGPSLVVFLSDRVFASSDLGPAIAASYALLGSTAAALLWAGRRHAAAAAQRGTDPATHQDSP